MPRQQKPEIVLLSSNKHPSGYSIIENYLDNIDFINIPNTLLDGIYITLNSGEKYKINKTAIKEDVHYDRILEQVLGLGVPNDIQSIEVVLDTSKAEMFIRAEADTFLSSIFTD